MVATLSRRTRPGRHVEAELTELGYAGIVGVDEVGRGAWAGPVSAGVALWTPEDRTQGVRDSKLLRPEARASVAARLAARVPHGIGHVWPPEIDQLGMTSALRLAVMRALAALEREYGEVPDAALLDGGYDFLAGVCPTRCIPKADLRCRSVAMASILAKVVRDRMMVEVAASYPEYDFASNKGYPSPQHRRALRLHGPTDLHRRSWAPMRALLGRREYPRGALVEDPQPSLF